MTLLYKQYVGDDRLSTLLSEIEELREDVNRLEMNNILREMYLTEIDNIREYIVNLMSDTSITDYILEDEIIELSKRILSLKEELFSYRQL